MSPTNNNLYPVSTGIGNEHLGYNNNMYQIPMQYQQNVPNQIPAQPMMNPGVSFYNRREQTQYNQQPPIQQPQPTQVSQPTQSPLGVISGKVVDGKDIVKVTEVPFGSYAVFPRADMKEIYLKTWNANGTTDTITYQPIVVPEEVPQPVTGQSNAPESNDLINSLIDKISSLESKIDSLITPATKTVTEAEKPKESREVIFS